MHDAEQFLSESIPSIDELTAPVSLPWCAPGWTLELGQAVLERLGVGLAMIDPDGVISWCNAAFGQLHAGPTPEAGQWVGRSVLDLHPAGDPVYEHPDALRLEEDPEARYCFERQVGQQRLTYVLRTIGAPKGDRRWYLLESCPLATSPRVRPGPFAEAALDGEGRILAANEGFDRLVGAGPGETLGRLVFELVSERDHLALGAALAVAWSGRQTAPAVTAHGSRSDEPAETAEVHLTRLDNRPGWAEFWVVGAEVGRAEIPTTMLVQARDVTARKRDELLLTEVFDAARVPYALTNPQGVLRSVNPAWRSQFGGLDTVGTSLVDLLGTETQTSFAQVLNDCTKRQLGGFELVVMVEAGRPGPFLAQLRATVLHDLNRQVDRILVSLDDLTDHALEVESARRNAGQVRATLDELDVAVVIHDADGRVREINLGAHRLFGPAASDLIGRGPLPPWWQAHRDDGTALAPTDHPATLVLGDHPPVARCLIGLRPDPSPEAGQRWYLVAARALFELAGLRRVGAVASYVEVTELYAEVLAARADHDRRVGETTPGA